MCHSQLIHKSHGVPFPKVLFRGNLLPLSGLTPAPVSIHSYTYCTCTCITALPVCNCYRYSANTRVSSKDKGKVWSPGTSDICCQSGWNWSQWLYRFQHWRQWVWGGTCMSTRKEPPPSSAQAPQQKVIWTQELPTIRLLTRSRGGRQVVLMDTAYLVHLYM